MLLYPVSIRSRAAAMAIYLSDRSPRHVMGVAES